MLTLSVLYAVESLPHAEFAVVEDGVLSDRSFAPTPGAPPVHIICAIFSLRDRDIAAITHN